MQIHEDLSREKEFLVQHCICSTPAECMGHRKLGSAIELLSIAGWNGKCRFSIKVYREFGAIVEAKAESIGRLVKNAGVKAWKTNATHVLFNAQGLSTRPRDAE